METDKLMVVAAELKRRVGSPKPDMLKPVIWVNEEECEINIAPSKNSFGHVYDLLEIALVAQFYGLSAVTCSYETGDGIRLY